MATGPNNPLDLLRSRSTQLWTVILFVYVFLFCTTGYVAFLQKEINPASLMGEEELALFEKYEAKQFLLDAYQAEGAAFSARQSLATQSFNVVLGALLGFLSASIAGKVSRKQAKQE